MSECQGKVRTYFISTVRSKRARGGAAAHLAVRTGGRMSLAEVVFGLLQAQHKEKMREANGAFCLSPRRHKR